MAVGKQRSSGKGYGVRRIHRATALCVWLLILLIPIHGISQALDLILSPAHFHVLSALALDRPAVEDAKAMQDDTVLAYLGDEDPPDQAAVAQHAHSLADASVVYVDGGLGGKSTPTDKAPADGATMMLPACERPLLADLPACLPADPRIAYRSRTVPPLERPPSRPT